MDYKIEIGRIHPAFFKHSHLFRRFDTTYPQEGDVRLKSPFFVLEYSFGSGVLSCDDENVLADFVDLIKSVYGSGVTREDIHDSIEWNTMPGKWSILNIGVCILADDDSGWDGAPNAIWFDAEIPGKLVSINAQFWNKQMLLDAWKLDVDDVRKLGGIVTVPNLVDSLVLHRGNKQKHDHIQELIGLCQ